MGLPDRFQLGRLAAACLLAALPACLPGAAQNVETRDLPEFGWWPMYLGGQSRNAVVRSKSGIISMQPRLVWRKTCVDFGDCSLKDSKLAGPGTPFIGGLLLLVVVREGGSTLEPDNTRSVAVADGMVFHVRGEVFALDRYDGKIIWTLPWSNGLWAWLQTPVYLTGNLLIVDSEGLFPGRINAHDPKQWKYWGSRNLQARDVVNTLRPFFTMGAPVAVRGHLFAYMPYDNNVRVLEAATGEAVCTSEPARKMSNDSNGPYYPAGIASDERLLFAVTGAGRLIAVDPLSCAVVWSVSGPICGLPVYSNGAVFVRDLSHRPGVFVSIEAATGKVLWRQKPATDLADVSYSPPPVVSGGQLLITATRRLGEDTSRDELMAFDASSGEALWTLNLGADVNAGYKQRPWDSVTPPLVHSTFAYIGVADELVGVDLLARKVVWREKLSCGVAQALAMGEGLLFVSDICGNLYAYGPSMDK